MSIFRTTTLNCKACGAGIRFELSHSVNADRRPDLREQILANQFQLQDCPGCGMQARVEPEFNYLDIGRLQWIAAWPRSRIGDWQELVDRSQASFTESFGAGAPAAVSAFAGQLRCRVVFGWPALREKVLLGGSGIDDVTLELAKAALIRQGGTPSLQDAELRLLAHEGPELVFAWQDVLREEAVGWLRVPRELLKEIEDDPAAWQALRDPLAEGPFVDLQRLFMPVPA